MTKETPVLLITHVVFGLMMMWSVTSAFMKRKVEDAPEVEPLNVPPPTKRRDAERRPCVMDFLPHVRSRYPNLDEGRAAYLIQEALTAQAGNHVGYESLVERMLSCIQGVMEGYISALERVIRELMSRPADIFCTDINLFRSTTITPATLELASSRPNAHYHRWTVPASSQPNIRYSLADAICYITDDKRLVLFHGTTFKSLLNMIDSGLITLPFETRSLRRRGTDMGAGLYVSADPESAKQSIREETDSPGVFIQFSICAQDASRLMGRCFPGPMRTSTTDLRADELVFYQERDFAKRDFNVFGIDAIAALHLEAIHLLLDDNVQHQTRRTNSYINQILEAQQTSRNVVI